MPFSYSEFNLFEDEPKNIESDLLFPQALLEPLALPEFSTEPLHQEKEGGSSTSECGETSSTCDNSRKLGRPTDDRTMANSDLKAFIRKEFLMGLREMNEKFKTQLLRTDKYRTMVIRLLKKVLAKAVSKIGVDSYSKSVEVDKFLPEYQKRFDQFYQTVAEGLEAYAEDAWVLSCVGS